MSFQYSSTSDFWRIFITEAKTNWFKLHFSQGTLAKTISIWGSGFSVRPDSSSRDLHSAFEVIDSSSDMPRSFSCKVSNRNWQGNYMVRDGRQGRSGVFGYNDSGGELIRVRLETPLQHVVETDLQRFRARLYVEGKDCHRGVLFGVYSCDGRLMWGAPDKAELVEVEIVRPSF